MSDAFRTESNFSHVEAASGFFTKTSELAVNPQQQHLPNSQEWSRDAFLTYEKYQIAIPQGRIHPFVASQQQASFEVDRWQIVSFACSCCITLYSPCVEPWTLQNNQPQAGQGESLPIPNYFQYLCCAISLRIEIKRFGAGHAYSHFE